MPEMREMSKERREIDLAQRKFVKSRKRIKDSNQISTHTISFYYWINVGRDECID